MCALFIFNVIAQAVTVDKVYTTWNSFISFFLYKIEPQINTPHIDYIIWWCMYGKCMVKLVAQDHFYQTSNSVIYLFVHLNFYYHYIKAAKYLRLLLWCVCVFVCYCAFSFLDEHVLRCSIVAIAVAVQIAAQCTQYTSVRAIYRSRSLTAATKLVHFIWERFYSQTLVNLHSAYIHWPNVYKIVVCLRFHA